MTSPTPTAAEHVGTARAVVSDFGGVLTSSVTAAFKTFGIRECGDAALPLRVLAHGPGARRLVEHEEGRISQHEFEVSLSALLEKCGSLVSANGLVSRLLASCGPTQR